MTMVDRAAVLIRLARLAAAGDPHDLWIPRLCEAGRQMIGGRGGSITLNSDEGSRLTLTTTDPVAAHLENLQDVLGEGPCRQAYRQNTAVVADLRDGSGRRWPEFMRSAREAAGEMTVHCFPMRSVGEPLGVFTVYARNGELTEPEDVVQFLADALGAAVLSDSEVLDVSGPWAARSVVHQATGMLVAQLRVRPDDGLAILRAHAFAQNATVEDVAEQIVQRRLDLREDT
jgi:hypothetical protein